MKWLMKIRDKLLGVDKLHYLINNVADKIAEMDQFNTRELKAFEVLKPYFPDGYLFETGFSMSFQAIQHILNDIHLYKPNAILEFGSGLSTQVISSFIQLHQLKTKLYSIDENHNWQESLGISNPSVKLLNFPFISGSPYSRNRVGKWYDISYNIDLRNESFDMVIVDGPKGNLCRYARYGFIPFVLDVLSKDAIIFIDDSDRPDESKIVRWTQESFPTLVNIHSNKRYTRLSGVENYYTTPS